MMFIVLSHECNIYVTYKPGHFFRFEMMSVGSLVYIFHSIYTSTVMFSGGRVKCCRRDVF